MIVRVLRFIRDWLDASEIYEFDSLLSPGSVDNWPRKDHDA